MTAPSPTAERVRCYHCGSDCPDYPVVFDEKSFCCDGCRSVYSLLNEHQLGQYYRFDERGGQAPPSLTRYEYLDNPEIAAQLLDFQNDTLAKITVSVPAIHCSACLYLLENLPRLHPGVRASRVDFLKKQVAIDYHPAALSLRQLAELLTRIGYEPLINRPNADQQARPTVERQLLTRLGVAGFCAGNIMLFAFPDYLGLHETAFRYLFGYLNLLLAIPAVFYAGWGYFESVGHSLGQRRINIDVPILLGILVAFGRGAYEVLSGTGAGYFDSVTGLIFFLLTGKWFQQKTYAALSFERDYTTYFPLAVTKVVSRQSPVVSQKAVDVQKTDDWRLTTDDFLEESIPIQHLRPGDRIRIRNGELIPADARLLAGRARIDYSFVTGESAPEPHQPGDVLLAGGRQVGERLDLEVLRDVSHSYLTQLWNHDAFKKEDKSRLSTFADQVGRYFTAVVLALAGVVGVYWAWLQHDPARALDAFTAILIVACPCALSLSYPFALGTGLRWLGRRGFYLKNAEVMETLARCDALVFDKTGTLTTANGSEARFVAVPHFNPLTASDEALAGALARQSTHPISQNIARTFAASGGLTLSDVQEVVGEGVVGWLGDCEIRLGSASFTHAPEGLKTADDSVAHLNLGGQYRGFFVVKAAYRPGLDALLGSLRECFALFLVSGDAEGERPRLLRWFLPERMLFRTQPAEKLRFVENLQDEGHRVVMVGDGLNDAGALRQADAGVALTENTLHFTPASDAILEARALPLLPRFLAYCRYAQRLIRLSFAVSLVYNFIGLSFAVTGELSPVVAAILMPVSSISMVLITTLGMRWRGKKWFGEA